jgi:hypothetical protein
VFARLDSVIVDSNSTYGMDVWCLFLFFFFFCDVLCLGRGLVTARSLVQGVLPIV